MNKKIIISIVVLVLVGVAFVHYQKRSKQQVPVFDGRNSTFTVEDHVVKLIKGKAESQTISTHYFGNEAEGDLNGDRKKDYVFLVDEQRGGTGNFFYVVAALSSDTGYVTTNAYFLGDRIAPQTTSISSNSQIVVNYADRETGEPMVARPSKGVTLLLKVTPQGQLTPVI